MNKKLDIYQKMAIFTAMAGLIVIFIGFFISTPINANIQKSTAIQPNEVHKIDRQTKEYIFEFDSTEELRCLCFVSDLEQVHIYQNEKLIYGIDEGKTLIGKTPGKAFHFVEIPSENCKIAVVSHSKYKNDSSLTFTIGNRNFVIREALIQSLPYVLVYFIIFLEGVILFFYWIIVRKELANNKVGLYLSILVMVSGLWFIRGSDFVSILTRDYIAVYFMGYILFLQIPFLLFAFLVYYWQSPCKAWIKNTYCIVSCLNMVICISLHISGIKEFRETVFVTHILLFLSFVYAFYGMYAYWKEHGTDYKVILTCIPLPVAVIVTLNDYFGFYKNTGGSYKAGGIATLLFLIFISAVTFYELSLQLREGQKNAIYKKLAITDLLTGLNNRNAYETWENEHKKDFDDVSIILCDLNNLKYYNDNYGHEVGDRYIIAASDILSKSIEDKGVCYRIGGDEFIIILKAAAPEIIKEILYKIESMQQEFNRSSGSLVMEIACGYATAEQNDNYVTDIVKRADTAMYAHKKHIKGKKDNIPW